MPALTDQLFAIYNPDTGERDTPMERIEAMLEFVNKVPGFHKLDMYQKKLKKNKDKLNLVQIELR